MHDVSPIKSFLNCFQFDLKWSPSQRRVSSFSLNNTAYHDIYVWVYPIRSSIGVRSGLTVEYLKFYIIFDLSHCNVELQVCLEASSC